MPASNLKTPKIYGITFDQTQPNTPKMRDSVPTKFKSIMNDALAMQIIENINLLENKSKYLL